MSAVFFVDIVPCNFTSSENTVCGWSLKCLNNIIVCPFDQIVLTKYSWDRMYITTQWRSTSIMATKICHFPYLGTCPESFIYK